METNNYQHIQELLNRFFEGETTNAEEKELYQFFSSSELPEQFRQYRQMFGFFESGIKEESEEKSETLTIKTSWIKTHHKSLIWGISAIAASFLLLFMIGNSMREDHFNPYEGSYIVRNGVKHELSEKEAQQAAKRMLAIEQQQINDYNNAMKTLQEHKEKIKNIKDKLNQINQINQEIKVNKQND